MIYLNLSTDFTTTPGGRYIADGNHSGELFYKSHLLPKYEEALDNNTVLVVNLDGCYGLPNSFIHESFIRFIRNFKNTDVKNHIKIVCDDEPDVVKQVYKLFGMSVPTGKRLPQPLYSDWFYDQVRQFPGVREEVLHFIGSLVTHLNTPESTSCIESVFSSGYCYYFALMLQHNFGGDIMWHYGYSHIVWLDSDEIAYDIHGVFNDYAEHDLVPVDLLGSGLNNFLHVTDIPETPEEINLIHKRVKEWRTRKTLDNFRIQEVTTLFDNT